MRNLTEVHYTPRELEVIKLFLMNFSRKETADIMDFCGNRVHPRKAPDA